MRVSDATLEIACRIPSDGTVTENTIHDLSMDLRDARAALRAVRDWADGACPLFDDGGVASAALETKANDSCLVAQEEQRPGPTRRDSQVKTPVKIDKLYAVKSEWRDGELHWQIEGDWISDRDLRNWCANNMGDDPWRHTDVIRVCHIKAYAERTTSGGGRE